MTLAERIIDHGRGLVATLSRDGDTNVVRITDGREYDHSRTVADAEAWEAFLHPFASFIDNEIPTAWPSPANGRHGDAYSVAVAAEHTVDGEWDGIA